MSDYYLSVAETAKVLRVALKKHFPTTKFSVRSKSYAGGASIDVGWTDGPTEKAVRAITGQFTGADFDGMIDMKIHNSSWLMPDGSACVAHDPGTEGSMGFLPKRDNPKPHPDARLVHFGADFIFANRRYTVDFLKTAVREVCLQYGYELAPVVDDGWGARIPHDSKEGDQGGDGNPTSIWALRNLAYAYAEEKYPFEHDHAA